MSLRRLVLATANAGKVRELAGLVAEWGAIDVRSLADLGSFAMPEETGATYHANAVAKARVVAAASDLPALADDSGLEVDALDGSPGVRSARWAASDEARNAKLLALLAGVPADRRSALYRAVVALAFPNGEVVTAEGTCAGRIADAPRGEHGFGYDPLFIGDELDGRTYAEVSASEKGRASHRARAMRALGRVLRARGIV
jgi:XTP/dITP diphosphohydrolase